MNSDATTMGEAIALSSPSGSMSKRARLAANERLRRALFGDGMAMSAPPLVNEHERLLRQAAELRALAMRGMKPRAYAKKADELEATAKQIQHSIGGQ